MDDLMSKGSPYTKLTEEIQLLRCEMEINNRLMSKLLDYKESQLTGDNTFREEWQKSKDRGSKISRIMLGIGAVSLAITAVALIVEMDEGTKIMLMDKARYWWHSVRFGYEPI